MKKTAALLLVALFAFSFSNAQDTWGIIKAMQKSSEKQLTNPKKNSKAKYWVKRAEIHMKLYNYYLSSLQKKSPIISFTMSKSTETAKKKQEGAFTIHQYPGIDVYEKDGSIVKWIVTDTTKEPLIKAYDALVKATELNADGKVTDDIKENLTKLAGPYYFKGKAAEFLAKDKPSEEDYLTCGKYFEYVLNCSEHEYVKIVDTVIYYNCGLVYQYGKDTAKAVEYYEKAINAGYEDTKAVYSEIYRLTKDKDLDAAAQYLVKAIEANPTDATAFINELVLIKKIDVATAYLEKQIAANPNDATSYAIYGGIFNSQGDYEKAHDNYKKALDLKPNDPDFNFNMGVVYYNYAKVHFDKANSAKTNKEYSSEKKLGEDELKKAVVYFEKSAETSTDVESKKMALRNVVKTYTTLADTEKSNAAKAQLEAL